MSVFGPAATCKRRQAAAFAIVAVDGNLYAGLWRPLGFTVLSVCSALLFLGETRGTELHAEV